MKLLFDLSALVLLLATLACTGACTPQLSASNPQIPHSTPPQVRALNIRPLDSPAGLAVCYGPYRAGQAPWGEQPTRAQLSQDLRIIARHFNTLRMYSALGPSRQALEVIRDEKLPIRVLLGAWIAPEARREESGRVLEVLHENIATNGREIDAAIELANEFPEIVAALIVGNETQVSWSGHRTDPQVLIGHIRRARRGVGVPVTTADDFNFWNKPEAVAVAREVDFIITHAYAMWNGTQLHEAIAFTNEKVREIRAAHPRHLVVLGETGWATQKHSEGEQATLIKGSPGEAQQSIFFDSLRRWAAETRTMVFFFEAFDEPWKGGEHPDEVEKHWGLYNVDRSPKLAIIEAQL